MVARKSLSDDWLGRFSSGTCRSPPPDDHGGALMGSGCARQDAQRRAMTGMTPATEITGIRPRAGPRFRRRREHGVAAWVCGTSPRCRTVRQAILLPWAFRHRPLLQGRIAMRPDTGVPRTCMTWAGGARPAPPCSIPGPLKRFPSQSTGTRRAPERLHGIARGIVEATDIPRIAG